MLRASRLFAAALHVAFLLAACSAFGQQSPYAAVCEITMPDGCRGSGTLIGVNGETGLVLSCRHLLERKNVTLQCAWPATGQVTSGYVVSVASGKYTDLALAICRRPEGIKAMEVVPFDPAMGPWVSVGYRHGKMRVAVANNAKLQPWGLLLDSAFIDGMSGGPSYDSKGRLVAVVSATDDLEGASVGGSALQQLLDSYRK